jgi:nitric oxide reductase subunit B
MFCLRYLIPEDRWKERAAKMSFYGLNIGLAWMAFATLFPLGIRQIYESVNSSYFDARSLDYLTTNTNTVIEWLRLPGDLYFIAVGVLPLLYLTYLGVRYTVKREVIEEPEEVLFTDVTEPKEPVGAR